MRWIRGLVYDWRWSKTIGDTPNRSLAYRLSWFLALRGYRRMDANDARELRR